MLEQAAGGADVPPAILKSLAWTEGYDVQSHPLAPVRRRRHADPVGRLRPARAGRAVGLACIGPGGSYRYLGQAPTVADGSFAVPATPPRGTWTFVVYTSASAGPDKGARSVRATVG